MLSRTSLFATGLLCSLLALSLAPSAAAADDPSAADSAKALYDAGVDLTAQKDFAGAEAKFLQAWALQKSYDVAANLGEVEMQLGKFPEAAQFFTFALRNYPASGKKEKREWIEGRLTEAKSKSATVTVTVNVPGAEVKINGKPAGKAPIDGEVFIAPGDCTVEATAPDHEPFTQTIRAKAGGSHQVRAELSLPKKSLIPGIAVGGVGVASLVAGVALYVVSTSKYEEARQLHGEIAGSAAGQDHCVDGQNPNPKCADLKAAADLSDALYTPGLALTIGGAVLTAAGGAYLVYALRSPASAPPTTGAAPPRVASRPALTGVGVRGTGLFLQGSF